MPNFRRHIFAVAAFALCSGQVLAVDPFTVKDIRVEGIQRTEAGTVFSYLPVKVGETFTDQKSIAAIKALYATGFFKDVRIEVDGDVLVVMVEERPTISTVDFTGTKEFEKDALLKALKEIGVGETRIFDKASVDRAEQELKRQYLSRGLYGVIITTTVTPIERNRVTVNFVIDEGDVSRIKGINIVGNKAFSDKDLHTLLSLTTPSWFSWYTKADQYSKQKLAGDIETLKSFYLNRGYIEMQVESTQVSITPDKKDIFITINIIEGEKYTVSDVKLEGEMFGREQELKSLLEFKKGDTYSGLILAQSTKKISERLGNFGYAFANVNANPEINRETKEVAFTIFIDPGKRVYVRRMNVAGNSRTRDEVVRREFRQIEGSWYDGNKIRLSRDRVDRLGYFKEVNVETPEVSGTTDQVDVNMSVVEKPTGNIVFGAGFSQSEKLTFTASIQEANFAGSGNTIGVDVNTSSVNKLISLSQTTPYFTDDGVSRSVEIFMKRTKPLTTSAGDYTVEQRGGKISFGIPFTELDTIFWGVGLDHTRVDATPSSPFNYQKYVSDNSGVPLVGGKLEQSSGATTTTFPLTMAWQRDSRDSGIAPSAGRYQRVNLELAPFGGLQYYRMVYQHQYYFPVTRAVTLALNGEFDFGRGMAGNTYPVFKNFYAGGIGSVRGYESSSLGAHDAMSGDPLGGSSRLFGNVELLFPLPGTNDRTLRWFAFLDAGNIFQEREQMRISELRYATGLGVAWISPMGPLKFSYGKALNAKPGDKPEKFQFQLGAGF